MFIFIELVCLPKRLQALKIVNEVETDFHRSVKFRIHTFTIEKFNLACFLTFPLPLVPEEKFSNYILRDKCITRQDKWDFYPFNVSLYECLALFFLSEIFFVDLYKIIFYSVCKLTLYEKERIEKKRESMKIRVYAVGNLLYYAKKIYVCTLKVTWQKISNDTIFLFFYYYYFLNRKRIVKFTGSPLPQVLG